jgi:TfoX/Sxy family transcriptional regulator of competence genes
MKSKVQIGPNDKSFKRIIDLFEADKDIEVTKMFGSPGIKVRGKVFAMLVKEKLVVKLSQDRVNEMVNRGEGTYFDPGHGKLMKQWVSVSDDYGRLWPKVAREAMIYVRDL